MATASAQSLERAKLAWRRSPLPGFLRWWGGELTALLPAGARAWIRRGPDVLWLGEAGGHATIRRARTGATLASIAPGLPVEGQRTEFARACAGIDPDDRRLLLVVPASQVLYRRLVMPAAAAADPRRVVGYELDRQTPFKPEQVYYDVGVSADAAPAGQVALDLYVAPKAEIDPLLERFNAIGAQPDAVDVQTADGTLAGIDLMPPGLRPRRTDRRARANFILGLVCVLLVVLVLSQWLANRRAALAEMQDEVQAMRAKATQSEQLRGQLTGALAASKFLVKRKSENPSALAVLDDLTRRLPATAWLDVLTLDDSGGLDIKGEAAKAAALVDTLGSSRLLQEPKLQGVIQPDPATGKERFELVARVRQQGATDGH
ncbi:MAG TPA: PilN domain-containing protein [Rhodanobacteraceae bacterium]|jgi:general secretion pathway protein L|nr:PilN domain-containing protein [Rhodanobacteraceae bacterium]